MGRGGFIFQAKHLYDAGLNVMNGDVERRIGPNQDALLAMVAGAEADAAFIRTGQLERVIAEGIYAPGDFRVLEAAGGEGVTRTTALYPEWQAVAAPTVAPDLVAQVRTALMGLTADHRAAQRARIQGFQAPLDVGGVVSAMRDLQIPPFD